MKVLDWDNPELQDADNLLNETSDSIFLSGKAGTGKSTFVRYFSRKTKKKHVILAPTGLAAINVEGQTIHSFFKLPIRPFLPGDSNLKETTSKRFRKQQIKLIKSLDLIIIDEVSMVRADILDAIDLSLRLIRQCSYLPFGGVQMLFVGDLYQIEPVVPADEWGILKNFYSSPYFFNAHVFNQKPLITIELHKVYRQKDSHFIDLLDRIRLGVQTPEDLHQLNERYFPSQNLQLTENNLFDPNKLEITLTTRKDVASSINARHLNCIKGDEYTFKGEIKGEFSERNLPTDKELSLKVNAQIMFVANDPDHRWVNGTLGVIESIDESKRGVSVILENGDSVDVSLFEWKNKRYTFEAKTREIKEEILGTFTQLPLKTAWAITVHKSQGLTFDNVRIDLFSGSFAKGQAYVALSRCRTLNGITLHKEILPYDIIVSSEVGDFYKKANDKEQITTALTRARAESFFIKASKLWNSKHFSESTESFLQGVQSYPEVLKEERYRRLIRHKVGSFAQLQTDIRKLRTELNKQKNFLAELSDEYVELGNMCRQMKDSKKAALKNYDKALRLNPRNLEALCAKVDLLVENSPREALKMAKEAFEIDASNVSTRMALAKSFVAVGAEESAIVHLLAAIALNPEKREPYLLLIEIYDSLNEPDKADLLRDRLPPEE